MSFKSRYPEVGPGFGHLQLPVVLSILEALKAEHLPGVIEAGFVSRDGPRSRGQVLRPPILLRQRQVSVGRAGVEGQRAPICEKESGGSRQEIRANKSRLLNFNKLLEHLKLHEIQITRWYSSPNQSPPPPCCGLCVYILLAGLTSTEAFLPTRVAWSSRTGNHSKYWSLILRRT